jgi:DNA invertase Pin-like site-specific DNA recombinase
MKRAVILARVSTASQNTDSQLNELEKLVVSDGYQLDECIIIDKKESATKCEESEVVKKLKNVIETNKIEKNVVFELSRLSRRVEVLENLKALFIKHSISLHCKVEGIFDFNQNTDMSKLIVYDIFKNMCAQEVRVRKERTKRGKDKSASENKFLGGKLLYGYNVDNNKNFIINNQEATVIQKLFEVYSKGMLGSKKLQKEMLNMGYNLQIKRINEVLRTKSYTGEILTTYRDGRKMQYKRQYPPIISIELFNKCREIAANTANRTVDKSSKHFSLSARLIKCSQCGGRLIAYHAKTRGQYACICGKHSDLISIDVIDGLSYYAARKFENEERNKDRKKEYPRIKNEIKALQNQIDNADNKINIIRQNKFNELKRVLKSLSDNAINDIVETETKEVINEIRKETTVYNEQITKLDDYITMNVYGSVMPMLPHRSKRIDVELTEKQKYDLVHKYIREINIPRNKKNDKIKDIRIHLINGDTLEYFYNSHRPKEYKIWQIIDGKAIYIPYFK